MMKPIISAWVILCALPLFFSFKNMDLPPAHVSDMVIKTEMTQKKRSFKLFLYNLQKKPTRVILLDEKKKVLMNEKVVHHNSFFKTINLQKLSNGDYELLVLQPEESKRGLIKMKNKGIEVEWD